MAQYAMLIYTKTQAGEAELVPGSREAHQRHFDEMVSAGCLVAAFALHPSDTATSIHGDAVTDGPFVEAKEVVAGFAIIEAPDLDAALEIARSNPAAQEGGGIELRPVEGGYIAGLAAAA